MPRVLPLPHCFTKSATPLDHLPSKTAPATPQTIPASHETPSNLTSSQDHVRAPEDAL